jgi:hypothetical protein
MISKNLWQWLEKNETKLLLLNLKLCRKEKEFLLQDIVVRSGNPPVVFYELALNKVLIPKDIPDVPENFKDFIDTIENFCT